MPLMGVERAVLEKVVEFLKLYHADPMRKIEKVGGPPTPPQLPHIQRRALAERRSCPTGVERRRRNRSGGGQCRGGS